MIRYVEHAMPRIAIGFCVLLFAAPLAADESPAPRMRGKLWVNPLEFKECARETAFARGDTVTLTGNGLQPGDAVAVTFEQGDVVKQIANGKANAQGAISIRTQIPPDAVVGTEARMRATVQSGPNGPDGNAFVLSSAPLQIFPDNRDSDGDGINDVCDNCPNLAGTDLSDLDGDGLGDPCDPCPTDPDNGATSDGVCADGNANPDVPMPQPAH
jgi:hypothetical protein